MSRFCALGFSLILMLPAAAAAETIIVGGDDDFPPYEFINEDGEAEGFNIDLIRALGKAAGFEPVFQLGPWEDSRAAITSGEIDVLPSFVAEFRDADMDFATAHLIIYHEVFVRQNSPDVSALEDLIGLELIVQEDGWADEGIKATGVVVTLIRVGSEREALSLLASGQHDAALASENVGRLILNQEFSDILTTIGPPLFPVSYALAVTKGNSDLLDRIDAGLVELKTTGEFNEIHQRWLGIVLPDDRHDRGSHWLLIIVAILLAGILLGMIWRFSRRSRTENQSVYAERFRRDSLTGLPNRVELEQAIEAAFKNVRTDHSSHALLHIDLDQFKLINDADDYQAGDEIICQVAAFLQKRCGRDDFVARLGSDEFAIILAPSRDPLATAEQLRQDLEAARFQINGSRRPISASIGLARLDDHTISIGELLKQAEAACYVAKESGRNRVHAYHAEDEAVVERHGQMRWVRELSLALKEDRLELYFQTIEPPQPEGPSDLIIEVLLRMRLANGDIVSAGEFVPAAEKYFFAHRIDRWVLEATLAWLETHIHRLSNLKRVFINLSARSLGDDRFLPYALEQLAAYNVPNKMIGFEITETAVMTHLKTGLSTIEHLRDLGCQFALDDFGVGISSMAYLKNLPIDVLKIDGSFARDLKTGGRGRAVLAEINELGHVLGKITVIEHVENDEIRAVMAELGIDLVQGYAVSHPRPLIELLDDPSLTG